MGIESLRNNIKGYERDLTRFRPQLEQETRSIADLDRKIADLQAERSKHVSKKESLEKEVHELDGKKLDASHQLSREEALEEEKKKKLQAANDNNSSGMKKAA